MHEIASEAQVKFRTDRETDTIALSLVTQK